MSGLLVYLCVLRPALYVRLLIFHTVAGVPSFILLGIFLYKQLKNNSKKQALLFAFYPLFSVVTLETPTPLVFTFILNITVVPLWFYFKFTEKMNKEEKELFTWKFATLCFMSMTVITGMIPVVDPVALKFSSAFRRMHGYFIFLFINMSMVSYGAAKNKRYHQRAVQRATVCLVCLILFSVAEALGFRALKSIPIQESYAKHTYPTKFLADRNKTVFKTINPEYLNRSEDCRFCHKIPFKQWKVSTHAYAGKNASFVTVLKSLTNKHGMEFGRLCITCHEPALAYSKNLSLIFNKKYLEKKSEGVSCRSCHYMSAAHFKNAWFEISIPRVDLTYVSMKKRQRYIFNSVLEHLNDVSKPAAKDGSMCFPCHSLESVRKGKTLIPYDNVTSFIGSPYSKILKCHDCHMPRLVEDETHHYSWKDHRMFGSQHYLSQVAIVDKRNGTKTLKQIRGFEAETLRWLSGRLSFIDVVPALNDETVKSYRIYNYFKAYKKLETIYHVLQSSQPFEISLQNYKVFSPAGERGKTLQIHFSIFNSTIGHDYPSSLFANISKTWIEVDVFDCKNKTIKGFYEGNNKEYILGRMEVDDDGTPIKPEDSKRYTQIVNNKFLEPLKSRAVFYAAHLPYGACFPLTAKIYIKNQRYVDDYYHRIEKIKFMSIKPYVVAQKNVTLYR